MQVVQDSAEHHFLTLLEKIKTNSAGWAGIHYACSRQIDHDSLIEDLVQIGARCNSIREQSAAAMRDLAEKAESFPDAVLYQFADSDLLLVARPANEAEQDAFYSVFKGLSSGTKAGLVDFINFGREMMGIQKLADKKLLAQKRMSAYAAMADENRVSSIGVRRQRREHALVLIVEDDRFTATYTSNILSKNYDLVHAKTGEDAVIAYIEQAPDIVFLDIHLPGLNGLETLHSIRKVDPEAYVVMLSVDTVKANIVTATNRGAAGFLKKPFSKDRLLAIVEKSPFIKGSKATIKQA
ncbi:MAG: response regulator [Micavibrio aeruginosavorus]|nr:response regulator [Micavibrio aeruginosavorus]